MNIGENIARLRKVRGLTQEQLGMEVGVSAQAVSKWENGGAPDAELLPSIADRLGVTIDALYGRGDYKQKDMDEILREWLGAIPVNQRMSSFFKLLSHTFMSFFDEHTEMEQLFSDMFSMLPVPTQYGNVDADLKKFIWFRGGMVTEEGVLMTILTEELPVYFLMPEPKDGYTPYLLTDEEYRHIFKTLSEPGALEIMRYLYSHGKTFYGDEVLNGVTDVPEEQISNVLRKLANKGWILEQQVHLKDRDLKIYEVNDRGLYMPFLFMTRWFAETRQELMSYYVENRKDPILKERSV